MMHALPPRRPTGSQSPSAPNASCEFRDVATAAERTVEETWRRVGALLPTFSPKECANYLKNSVCAAV